MGWTIRDSISSKSNIFHYKDGQTGFKTYAAFILMNTGGFFSESKISGA
jgi:hypothetical protein